MKMIKQTYSKIFENYHKRRNILNNEGLLKYITNSSGYILIIVLIIVSLLVGVSTDFIIVAQTNLGYMQKFENRLKASYHTRSGFQLGKLILSADRSGVSLQSITGRPVIRNVDSYNNLWATDFPSITLGDADVKIKIMCENSKINLSILANEFVERTPFYGITQHFFMNMGLSMDYADIIIDWVSPGGHSHPRGASSSYYQTLSPPYKAKSNEMNSIAELLMVKDMTPEIYYGLGGGNYDRETNLVDNNYNIPSLDFDAIIGIAEDPQSLMRSKDDKDPRGTRETETGEIGREKSRRLSDYFRVYGFRDEFFHQYNKININTASYRVLSALTDYMTDAIVTEIIRRRQVHPFTSVDEVKDLITDENVRNNLLTVRSHIFKIDVSVYLEGSEVNLTAYYNVDEGKVLYWLIE